MAIHLPRGAPTGSGRLVGGGRAMALVVPHSRAETEKTDGAGGSAASAVLATVSADTEGNTTVVLRRADAPPIRDPHLRVEVGKATPKSRRADVVVGHSYEVDELARQHPGALVVAGRRSAEYRLRLGPDTGMVLRITGAGSTWPMWSSVLHAWLVAGLPPAALGHASGLAVHAGGGHSVRLRSPG
jgi:hypothetical protein